MTVSREGNFGRTTLFILRERCLPLFSFSCYLVVLIDDFNTIVGESRLMLLAVLAGQRSVFLLLEPVILQANSRVRRGVMLDRLPSLLHLQADSAERLDAVALLW